MNINNYNRSDATTAYQNNLMSIVIEGHSVGNQILSPERVETFLENNEHEQRQLENEMQISSSFDSGSLEYSLLETDSSYEYMGKTVDVYLSVLEDNLNTLRMSDKDKYWITESTLCAIPFGNPDVRKWTAEDVVFYLDKFSRYAAPINYQYNPPNKKIFQNFINKDINGEVFLTFTLTDLLATIKPPKRRQVLIIYGAILILRKYISIYYTKSDDTYGTEGTGLENSFIDDIVQSDLCLNADAYFADLEAELVILKLSDKDKFWITESVISSMPMFGTIDVRKWTVRDVIGYLKQLVKVSAIINCSNINDVEKNPNMFGKFINEDINGAALLMLTQRDLLNLIKPPSRRLVLIIYGAILILKKYSDIFHP